MTQSTDSLTEKSTTPVKVLSHEDYLNNITIVMVNTTLPANIGSAARAMFTMGLTHLTVVDPKHPIDNTSIAHAAGAGDVLENTKIVDTLDDAIANAQLIFAASSRQRHIPRPVVTPTGAAALIVNHLSNLSTSSFTINESANLLESVNQLNKNTVPTVALLFGREDRGLTNEELALADYHIQIEANPAYPVLNVASAIQVISSFFYSYFNSLTQSTKQQSLPIYEVTQSSSNNETPILSLMLRQIWDAPAITHTQKKHLQQRIVELMHHLELIESTDGDKLRDLPNRLSRLMSRLQLDEKEYALLNAIIAKLMLTIDKQ